MNGLLPVVVAFVGMGDERSEAPPSLDQLADMQTGATEADLRRVGANIRFARTEKGLSQAALADAMREAGQGHWRQNTVSRVENGRQEVYLGELDALERILGGVLAGTELESALRDMGNTAQRVITVKRLRQVHQALIEAEKVISELRAIYGDRPEGGG